MLAPLFAEAGLLHRWHRDPRSQSRSWNFEQKVIDEPVDHGLGRSAGGFGTKLHVLCDASGWLLTVALTPGQTHEMQAFETVMERVSVKSARDRASRE